jgi:hypothetical protein
VSVNAITPYQNGEVSPNQVGSPIASGMTPSACAAERKPEIKNSTSSKGTPRKTSM